MTEVDERAALRPGGAAMVLFLLYCLAYAGFIALALLRFDLLGAVVGSLGINIAVLYGFGLIGGAFGVAVLYLFLRRDGRA
jgi:uncharacterized membrane protein (DUF485 family)